MGGINLATPEQFNEENIKSGQEGPVRRIENGASQPQQVSTQEVSKPVSNIVEIKPAAVDNSALKTIELKVVEYLSTTFIKLKDFMMYCKESRFWSILQKQLTPSNSAA